MKEIISAVFLLGTLFGGTVVLKEIHDWIRVAALTKASKGLPSLVEMTKNLQQKSEWQVGSNEVPPFSGRGVFESRCVRLVT